MTAIQVMIGVLVLLGLALVCIQWQMMAYAIRFSETLDHNTEINKQYLEISRSYWQAGARSTEEAKQAAQDFRQTTGEIARTVAAVVEDQKRKL